MELPRPTDPRPRDRRDRRRQLRHHEALRGVPLHRLSSRRARPQIPGPRLLPGLPGRRRGDHGAAEGALRLHLLHGVDGGGEDRPPGGQQVPDADDAGAGGEESGLLGRERGYGDGDEEDPLGEVHERGADVRRARLPAVQQAGAGEVRCDGAEGSRILFSFFLLKIAAV